MTKRAWIIANPAARTLPSRDRLATASAWLRLHGWSVETRLTDAASHATDLAREAAADGCDVVIAAGGDGTVNEVVNGIAGSHAALAVIPGGTANIWSREIGSPAHPGSVAAMIENGVRRRIDLGVAGGRYFLLMASFGLDSSVAATIAPEAKSRFGRQAYVAHGLREALRYRGVRAEITAGGETWQGQLLIGLLGNTRSYGGMIKISNRARADDGLLDLVIYPAGSVPRFAGYLARTVAGLHNRARGVVYRQVREATVTTATPLPVQIDGEVIGTTPITFAIEPAALDVILPAGRASAIFG